MSAPTYIAVAGDWHCDTQWATQVVKQAGHRLRALGEEFPLVLQLGDFGLWGGKDGATYLEMLSNTLKYMAAEVWFIDGNHEDFDRLERYYAKGVTDHQGRAMIRPYIRHLPRGHRWRWHDRTWLAMGGAASLDKHARLEREADRRAQGIKGQGIKEWWEQEEITFSQAHRVLSQGPADVMLTHDCPSSVVHSYGHGLEFPGDRLLASDEHSRLLQAIADGVKPQYLMHGHLHMEYSRLQRMPHGTVRVTGLDRNPHRERQRNGNNWVVLNIETMEFVL